MVAQGDSHGDYNRHLIHKVYMWKRIKRKPIQIVGKLSVQVILDKWFFCNVKPVKHSFSKSNYIEENSFCQLAVLADCYFPNTLYIKATINMTGSKSIYSHNKRRSFYIQKSNWQKRECNGCRAFSQECRQGVCYLQPYTMRKFKIKKEKKEL